MNKRFFDLLNEVMNYNGRENLGDAKERARRVLELLDGHELTACERLELLDLAGVKRASNSSKIAGAFVCNSCAKGCAFCKAMKEKAKDNPNMICRNCYAVKDERFWKVEAPHIISMVIFSEVLFDIDELKTLPIFNNARAVIRFNESGDLTGATMARNWLRICKAFDRASCGLYTKNAGALAVALKNEGKPENCSLVFSSFEKNKEDELNEMFDYLFTVYDDDHAGEAIENGGKACQCFGGAIAGACEACGWKCYGGTNNPDAWEKGAHVVEELRK